MTRIHAHGVRFVAMSSLGLALVACSSSPGSSPQEQLCGGARVCVMQADPEVCNQIVNDGPIVTPSVTDNVAPAAVGGAISDGHWVMTAVTVYLEPAATPPNASITGRQALTITGSTLERVTSGSTGPEATSTQTFLASGAALTLTDICPSARSGFMEVWSFSATAQEMRWCAASAQGTTEITYVKR